jgi:phosphate transport system permease protein
MSVTTNPGGAPSRVPSLAGSHRPRRAPAEIVFAILLPGACVVFLLLFAGVAISLAWGARLSMARFGLPFLWHSEWNPVTSQFGALPFIYGSVVTSAIALLLALLVGIPSGIFLAEFAPRRLAGPLGFLIEMLAAVPSVVYGLWGLFVLAPAVSGWIGPALQDTLGFLPIFQGTIYGVNLFTASLILALMIVPVITSIVRDLIAAIPGPNREAALALGATRWEAVRHVMLPAIRSGVFGASMLALGRALGETIATTMVIGNRPAISVSLFAPGYTVSSVIANEFTEATTNVYLSALLELGLILLLVSVIVNGVGRGLLHLMISEGQKT